MKQLDRRAVRIARAAVIAAAAVMAACEPGASSRRDLAASVDGVAITISAVDAAVAELGPSATGSEQERRQLALEALVTQRVLVNAALAENLDEDARVRSQLDTERLKVLAKAYLDRHTTNVPEASPQAVRSYFDSHPELFAQRRIYRLQQLAIEVSDARLPDVVRQYEQIGTLNDMVDWLRANGLRYATTAVVKPAEELPADFVPVLATMKNGDTARVPSNGGITIVQVTGLEDAPLTFEQAGPMIRRYLKNQTIGASIQQIASLLRERAAIEYYPPFEARTATPR